MLGGIARDIAYSNSSFSQTSASGKSSTALHKGGFRQVSSLVQYQQSPGIVSQLPLENTPSYYLQPISNPNIRDTGVTSMSFDCSHMAVAYIDNATSLPVLTIYQGVQNQYSVVYSTTPSDATPITIESGIKNSACCVISSDATICVLACCLDDNNRGAMWTYYNSGSGWQQTSPSKIVPADLAGIAPQFGTSIALSTNNSTVVVGAPQDGFAGDYFNVPGAFFVFKQMNPGVYLQLGPKLVGVGSTNTLLQGASVCVSANGSVIGVGAPYDGYSLATPLPVGCGFIFVENNLKTTYVQNGPRLSAGDSGTVINGLSCAINQSGTLFYLGCPFNAPGNTVSNIGVAVFERAGAWNLQTYIATPRSVVGLDSQFGRDLSLSLDGNTLVVQAIEDINYNVSYNSVGSFYIFSRSGGGSSPNVYTQNGIKIFNTNSTAVIGDVSLSGDGKCLAYYNVFQNAGFAAPLSLSEPAQPGESQPAPPKKLSRDLALLQKIRRPVPQARSVIKALSDEHVPIQPLFDFPSEIQIVNSI